MIVTLEEDPATGDLILPIPEELMKELGWEIGDTLVFEEYGESSWIIEKRNK